MKYIIIYPLLITAVLLKKKKTKIRNSSKKLQPKTNIYLYDNEMILHVIFWLLHRKSFSIVYTSAYTLYTGIIYLPYILNNQYKSV